MARGLRRSGSLLVVVLALGSFVLLRLSRIVGDVGARPWEPVQGATQVHERERTEPSSSLTATREAVAVLEGAVEAVPSDARFITGTVTERSGRPVAEARCELRPSLPAGGFIAHKPESSLSVLASTTSGQDGTFRLPAGDGFWKLVVESPGFARFERDHLLAGDDVRVSLDATIQLLVSVVDAEAQPVEAAEISLREAGEPAPGFTRGRMRTDANGRASTSDVVAGTWTLVVRHPRFAVADLKLEIPVGERRIAREIRLERGTRVVGTIRGAEGEPIAGAQIRIQSPYRNLWLLETATSDTDGRYASSSIFALQETLEVLATAEGHAECTTWLGIQPSQARAGEAVLDFTLASAARILAGRVITEAGNAVPSASVRLAAIDPVGTSPTDTLEAIQNAPHSAWLWREAARTGEDGRFELDGLAPSPQYILLVVQEGLAPRVLWAPAGASGTRTDLGEIELVPCGGLFGRAVFADGTPAAGETLHLQRVVRVEVASAAELGRWRPDSWFQVLETVAGADGGFRFDLLAPGSYEFLSVASGSAEVVPGRATGPVEAVLRGSRPETTSEVSGVVQSEAGDPIPLVFVRAIVGNGTSERLASASLVDAHGAFSLPVPADSVARLAFTHLHGVYEERDVLVGPADRTAPLVIVLMERARHLPALDGLVLGPRGDPLEGSAVTLHPPEDSLCACISFQARTDSAGSFRFEVSEGPHRLVATDPRFASATYAPAWPGDHVLIDLDDP